MAPFTKKKQIKKNKQKHNNEWKFQNIFFAFIALWKFISKSKTVTWVCGKSPHVSYDLSEFESINRMFVL